VLLFVGVMGCGAEPTQALRPGASRIVAVGAHGLIAEWSAGGWQIVPSGTSADLSAVVAHAGGFVAVGNGGAIVSSTEPGVWAAQESGTSIDLNDIVDTGTKLVAVGGDWSTGATTVVREDGEHWRSVLSPQGQMFHAIATLDQLIIAAAYLRSDLQLPKLFASRLEQSSALSGWAEQPGPDFFDSVRTPDGVAVAGGGTFARSTDGITWTSSSLPIFATAIARDGPRFVVAGGDGAATSLDGVAWETIDGSGFTGAAAGGGEMVLVARDGTVRRSGDGVEWSDETIPSASDVRAVAVAQ